MSIKSRVQGFALEAAARPFESKAYAASDCCWDAASSPDWVPFEHNHLGFFTIYDGDFEKYIHDFAEKTSLAFNALFPHVSWCAAHPGGEERPRVL